MKVACLLQQCAAPCFHIVVCPPADTARLLPLLALQRQCLRQLQAAKHSCSIFHTRITPFLTLTGSHLYKQMLCFAAKCFAANKQRLLIADASACMDLQAPSA